MPELLSEHSVEQSERRLDVHEVVARTKATLPQIEHLFRCGLITAAELAPRRGVSRKYSLPTAHYIAVASRLLSFVTVPRLKQIIGDDQPMLPAGYFREQLGALSVVEHIWQQLDDPARADAVEILFVARVEDPQSGELLFDNPFFMSAQALMSAAASAPDGAFLVNMRELKMQFEDPRHDAPAMPAPVSSEGPDDAH